MYIPSFIHVFIFILNCMDLEETLNNKGIMFCLFACACHDPGGSVRVQLLVVRITDGHPSEFQLIEQECWVSSCCLFPPSSVGVKPGRRHSSVCVYVCSGVEISRLGAR